MSPTPIKYTLRSSWYLAGLLLFFYLGAIVILTMMPWPAWIILALASFCFIWFLILLRKHVLFRSKKSTVSFWQAAEDSWGLEDRSGTVRYAQLQNDSICTVWFVLLNFRCNNKKFNNHHSIIILPDTMSQDEFRQLRVSLKY